MFTLEYLPDGSDDCPLVRLYAFESPDVVALQGLCFALADRRVIEVNFEKQPWVQSIGETRLTLRVGDANRGIRATTSCEAHVLEYTREGWLDITDKLTPFICGATGFQWLNSEGDVNVLISADGLW